MKPSEKEMDIFELELAIKWAHAASLMDTNPEVSYLFCVLRKELACLPPQAGGGDDMKIKMLETVRPDFPLLLALAGVPADTILICGEVYEATQNKYGAVCGICENGQKLGVKPGEFEIVEDTP